MTNATLEEAMEMAEFKVVDKPIEAKFGKASKYAKILSAIQHIAGDKAIEVPAGILGDQSFQSFKFGLKQAGKKAGLPKIGAVRKHGVIFIYNNR